MADFDVLIIGAGLAGLSCARHLHQKGVAFQIVEASDGVGGRVRTDEVEGFLLDRGFQVLLTAYPEARRVLDYEALALRSFYPGALVWWHGRFHKVADPWRKPLDGLRSIANPVGTFADKLRVGSLRRRVREGPVARLFRQPATTTEQALRDHGFTDQMIDRFFRPFLGGIFLNRELQTSSRMFTFVFRMFAEGETAVPAKGIGQIPAQMAAALPPGSVRLNSKVTAVEDGRVVLASGETITAETIVVATDGPTAAGLIGDPIEPPASLSVTCLYFAADHSPLRQPLLVLDGEGRGPVNNMHIASIVTPACAPPGQHLISTTVLGNPKERDGELATAVRTQLAGWFGPEVNLWRHLRTYRIVHAQPAQAPPALRPPQRPVQLRPGLYVCGDHRDNASIHGAMVSGRRTAEAILYDRPVQVGK